MKLKKYLEKEGLSLRDFGKKIEVSHTSIDKYCKGTRTPSLNVMKKITKATKGQVTIKDF